MEIKEKTIKKDNNLRGFYENEYERGSGIYKIPRRDNFMYGPIFNVINKEINRGIDVLDLGCSIGIYSIYMAKKGCHVTGIDIAHNAIEIAKCNANHYNINNIEFKRMDFLNDWENPNYFDIVLCSHLIEHIPEHERFVQKIAFSLKPEGKIILIAPTKYSFVYRANMFFKGKYQFDKSVGHLRRYSTNELINLVLGANMDIKSFGYYDSFLRDIFIMSKTFRKVNRIFTMKYVRNIFNSIDTFSARFIYPGSMWIVAQKKSINNYD